jgi:hypothetical protein
MNNFTSSKSLTIKPYKMKFIKLSILTLLTSVVLLSCSKNSDDVIPHNPAPGISGDWIGKYGFGNETPAVYFRFNIQADGKIDELNSSGNSKGGGTWELNGASFTAHYQWKAPMNTIFSVAATYNEATHKLTGTWGYDNSTTNGGLWEQTKQ